MHTTGDDRTTRVLLRPLRALAYLATIVPLPAVAALVVALALAAGRWELAVLLAGPLLAAYVALAVAAAPLQRRAVVLAGHPPVVGHGAGRAAALALIALLLAPLDVAVLTSWLLGSPLLLSAPLLAGEAPLALGPWTVETTGEAWLATAAGAGLLLAGAVATVVLAEAHAGLTRTLLGRQGADVEAQVTELSRSRLRLVDAFDVERRRIERDLHDGAQQQLVNLAMTLDLARIELEDRPDAAEAARLVDHAHAQATDTLAQLRALIRGIHPPQLSERGLDDALRALADGAAVQTRVAAGVGRRLPEPVEAAAYFVVSEAVANAGKHSGATTVDIVAGTAAGLLELEVRDNGTGGADPRRGTGLAGLGDRVAAVGGRLTLTSPPGGPTVVRAELPLELDAA